MKANILKSQPICVSNLISVTYRQAGLLAELGTLGVGEVVVREGRVQRGDQVEERLPGDGVAESDLLVVAARAPAAAAHGSGAVVLAGRRRRRGQAVASITVLRRGERLQRVRAAASFRVELLVELLLGADHLARIAFDPAVNIFI